QGLLRRPLRFRHVLEVDADAVPHRRSTAHAVDQDVRHVERGGGLRMALLPALETGERVVLAGGARGLDDRDRGTTPAGRCRARAREGAAFLGGAGEPAFHRRAILLTLRLSFRRVVLGGRTALFRGLNARRLALLLAVVRWPRCVAEPLCLVARRQL